MCIVIQRIFVNFIMQASVVTYVKLPKGKRAFKKSSVQNEFNNKNLLSLEMMMMVMTKKKKPCSSAANNFIFKKKMSNDI